MVVVVVVLAEVVGTHVLVVLELPVKVVTVVRGLGTQMVAVAEQEVPVLMVLVDHLILGNQETVELV
jgi:hypothetical protein